MRLRAFGWALYWAATFGLLWTIWHFRGWQGLGAAGLGLLVINLTDRWKR